MKQVKVAAIKKQATQVQIVKVNSLRIDAPQVLFFVIGQCHGRIPLQAKVVSLRLNRTGFTDFLSVGNDADAVFFAED